jgi:hypothetical protein
MKQRTARVKLRLKWLKKPGLPCRLVILPGRKWGELGKVECKTCGVVFTEGLGRMPCLQRGAA